MNALIFVFENYRYSEIAKRLGVSISAVKNYADRFKKGEKLSLDKKHFILEKMGFSIAREVAWTPPKDKEITTRLLRKQA